MYELTPPESVHALGLADLRRLAHIVAVAGSRADERLRFETGSGMEFRPAHRLYESLGFVRCAPFGDHVDDPNGLYMALVLRPIAR